jgi:hypothetical protein
MRPYLVLMAVVLTAVTVFGQQPFPRPDYGACIYGCGPYIPLITTPEISLQTVSPNPVGASNATTGLIAGATNSTLSQIEGSTSSEYTEAVWYEGGAPLSTSTVHLRTEQVGREGHILGEPMREERPPQERAREERPRENRIGEDRTRKEKDRPREEHAAGEQAPAGWTFFTGRENSTDSTSVVKGFRKAARVYTNDDVTRQNDKNGVVKYDSKTEKL